MRFTKYNLVLFNHIVQLENNETLKKKQKTQTLKITGD